MSLHVHTQHKTSWYMYNKQTPRCHSIVTGSRAVIALPGRLADICTVDRMHRARKRPDGSHTRIGSSHTDRQGLVTHRPALLCQPFPLTFGVQYPHDPLPARLSD